MLLKINHVTTYRYSVPVHFRTHRLLIRPLEGHDLKIRSATLAVQPNAEVRWLYDAFDNTVALVDIAAAATELRLESQVIVEQFNINPFVFTLEEYAQELPFAYEPALAAQLTNYLQAQCPADKEAIGQWLRPFLNLERRAATLDFLTAINRVIPLFFNYCRREEEGVQSPGVTLRDRQGSCRDYSLLFIEAARYMGLAARFVTGYLHTEADQQNTLGNATHAWAEVFLPGAGWKGFDPTSGVLAAQSHVRTGVSREPSQAVPISGTFVGPADALLGMDVQVTSEVLASAV